LAAHASRVLCTKETYFLKNNVQQRYIVLQQEEKDLYMESMFFEKRHVLVQKRPTSWKIIFNNNTASCNKRKRSYICTWKVRFVKRDMFLYKRDLFSGKILLKRDTVSCEETGASGDKKRMSFLKKKMRSSTETFVTFHHIQLALIPCIM